MCTYVYNDTVFMFYGLCRFFKTHLYCLDECLRITILDTCCFGCLICMCFIFLYLHLFSAIEHVSHKMLP